MTAPTSSHNLGLLSDDWKEMAIGILSAGRIERIACSDCRPDPPEHRSITIYSIITTIITHLHMHSMGQVHLRKSPKETYRSMMSLKNLPLGHPLRCKVSTIKYKYISIIRYKITIVTEWLVLDTSVLSVFLSPEYILLPKEFRRQMWRTIRIYM